MVCTGWGNILAALQQHLENIIRCLGSGAWFNNILLKLLHISVLGHFRCLCGWLFFCVSWVFCLFWPILSLLKFYISWIKSQGIHVSYPWVTVFCVKHKLTNHFFSLKCLFPLLISFPVCLTPHLFIFFVSVFSPSLPQNFHWPFSLRCSVSLLSIPPISQYFLAVWSIFCIYTLDPCGEVCGAKDNIFLLSRRCCVAHKKVCAREHRIMEWVGLEETSKTSRDALH